MIVLYCTACRSCTYPLMPYRDYLHAWADAHRQPYWRYV